MTPRKQALLVAAMTLAALLPFVDKAFHIDDTLFLKAARQISTDPLDFYGFSVNWYGTEQRMSDVTKNPPLASYFLALAAAATGWSERSLHAAFLLPAIASALGIHALARRLTTRPLLATVASLATPAFLVSSTNVMCDTMLVAFWVWSVEMWLRGVESGRVSSLVLAGVLASAAAMTKYFGVALVPLLLTYGVMRRRRIGGWALALVIPILVIVAYQLWTRQLYGRGLLSDAATYANVMRRGGLSLASKSLVGLSFTGGCLASVVFLAPWLWSKGPVVAATAAGIVLTALLAAAGHLGPFVLATSERVRVGSIAQIVVFAIGGAAVLALAFTDLVRERDADAMLLFLWVGGTFLFAVFLNWTVNARSLLPAVPAVGILAARRLESRGFVPTRLVPALPLSLAGALAIAAGGADWSLAGTARTAAAHFTAGHARGTLWFEGHWGFQHYMEAAGAKALDAARSRLSTGDRIAIQLNNTNLFDLPMDAVTRISAFDLPVLPGIATISAGIGAGFYAHEWGPLPVALGRVPPERFFLLEVVRDLPPEAR